jgi:Fe-S-cluster containining protein
MSDCDGRCCASFTLPKDAIERFQNGANGDDAPFILDMLIPLTRRQQVARVKRLGYGTVARNPRDKAPFTCRHWDEKTRLCTVYEQRPGMCRDFPYGRPCEHEGCECKDGYDSVV